MILKFHILFYWSQSECVLSLSWFLNFIYFLFFVASVCLSRLILTPPICFLPQMSDLYTITSVDFFLFWLLVGFVHWKQQQGNSGKKNNKGRVFISLHIFLRSWLCLTRSFIAPLSATISTQWQYKFITSFCYSFLVPTASSHGIPYGFMDSTHTFNKLTPYKLTLLNYYNLSIYLFLLG